MKDPEAFWKGICSTSMKGPEPRPRKGWEEPQKEENFDEGTHSYEPRAHKGAAAKEVQQGFAPANEVDPRMWAMKLASSSTRVMGIGQGKRCKDLEPKRTPKTEMWQPQLSQCKTRRAKGALWVLKEKPQN